MKFYKLFFPKLFISSFADGGAASGGGDNSTNPSSSDANNANAQEAGAQASSSNSQDENNKTVPLAALKEERSKRQALQAEVEQLKAMFYQQTAGVQGGDPYGTVNAYTPPQQSAAFYQQQFQQQAQPQQVNPIEQLWETNPVQAVQAQISQAFQTYDRINTFVEQQITMANTKYQDFDQYREQVRNYINTIPVSERAKPGIIDAAYFIVKGQNADKIAEQARLNALNNASNALSAQGVGSSMPVGQNSSQTALTPQEQEVARIMGLTDEEYLANKRG